ncbi:MAG TPA: hypothetical protein VFQ37_10640 [Mycobacterium sp.]|nr:hypothetical protein [Mycobacterium sp.]
MTTATDTRQELSQLAEQSGWQRREHDRVDVYLRGRYRVHAIWRDSSVLNGGSHYEDDALLSYTRDLAKLQGWLAK